MLFNYAKGRIKGKNAIGICLSKASGQSISMVFSQQSSVYETEKTLSSTEDNKLLINDERESLTILATFS